MHPRPNPTPTFTPPPMPQLPVKVSTNPVSTVSGLPCTFFGGMTAIGNGCAAGVINPNPVQGCITQAFQSSAAHTAGCINVEPNRAPTKK